MNILDLIVGKPLKTSDERAEQIGPAAGIPIFGLDGLSSAAYGPEAALSLLIPLGLLGVQYAAKMGFLTVAIARGQDKAPLARQLGASVYIDSQTQDPAAELLKVGVGNLHPMARDGIAIGLLVGTLWALLEWALPKHKKYLPSPTGIGLGVLAEGHDPGDARGRCRRCRTHRAGQLPLSVD